MDVQTHEYPLFTHVLHSKSDGTQVYILLIGVLDNHNVREDLHVCGSDNSNHLRRDVSVSIRESVDVVVEEKPLIIERAEAALPRLQRIELVQLAADPPIG